LADSIGGGAVRIFEIDKCKVDINGECYECLIYSLPENKIKIAEQVKNLLPGKNEVSFSECNGRTVLIEVKSQQPINADKLIKLINKDDILKIRYIHPINKMVPAGSEKVPFHSAKEMLAYAEKNHMNLYQTAVDYESNITGLSEDQILKNGHELWNIIKKSIDEGLAGNFNMNGIVTPKAKQFKESIDMKKTLPMGVMDIAGPIALGIMEYSNASGVIVCIPTGGSSGIVPACLSGTAKQLGSGENKIVEALLVSGILGVCMADDNHFSGGQYGCQAEVGCASAMAAGAVVYMLDGTAQQSCDAASMALQCLLGLVCDPVAGLVQVPCLARNISCAATSILSANAVISGFDVVVPFDEMFNALKAVGKIVCKSTGMGATNTPTGNRLKEKQLEKDILLRKQV
jgi:L-serine dehydratase